MAFMPFTLSHAAAAIPFLRTRLIPSALVIGCLAPDFEYFMRLDAEGSFGHTIPGLLGFDLPVSLLVLWTFHAYAKEPIYAWLPEGMQRRIRLEETRAWPIRTMAQFWLVALSILIGSATHILWDSFTHRAFWPYHHWPFLKRTILVPLYGPLEWLRVIQHVSTIVGAIVLLLWFLVWYRKTAPAQSQPARGASHQRSLLVVLCIAALGVAVLRAFVGAGLPVDIGSAKDFLAEVVVTSITVLWLGIAGYGFYRVRQRRQLHEA